MFKVGPIFIFKALTGYLSKRLFTPDQAPQHNARQRTALRRRACPAPCRAATCSAHIEAIAGDVMSQKDTIDFCVGCRSVPYDAPASTLPDYYGRPM